MCLVLYIASDVPLRTRPWDRERRAFHVTDVPEHGAAVKRHLTKPFVYYLGSHEGCGCGFQAGLPTYEGDATVDPAERTDGDASRFAIEAFVREALTHQKTVELYACWSGDEAEPPETRRTIVEPRFRTGFEEREFLVVGRDGSGSREG